MQMHELIFSEIYSHLYAIFHRLKKYKKINSKFGFQKRKPDFGFKTENRISGFRLTSLIESMNCEELAVKERTRVMMPLLIITAVH